MRAGLRLPVRAALLLLAALLSVGVAAMAASPAAAAPWVGLIQTATTLDAGSYASCAVTNAGDVSCWGFGGNGELGTGTGDNRNWPSDAVSLPVGSKATAITAGLGYSCALLNTGGVSCWGTNVNGQLGVGVFGGGMLEPSDPIALPAGTTALAVSAGETHACAVLNTGRISCWGANDHGQLGTGNTTPLATPSAPISLPGGVTATAVSAGGSFTCALLSTAQVSCWGIGDNGILGIGAPGDRNLPSAPLVLPGGATAKAITTGDTHSCAVLSTGQISCWGSNLDGRLGTGDTTNAMVPSAPIALPNGATASAVSATWFHTCALLSSGKVSCWGYNGYGELGTGTTGSLSSPSEPISLPSGGVATAISTGIQHSCAVINSGEVSCWGYNFDGELGTGYTDDTTVPVLTGVPSVRAAPAPGQFDPTSSPPVAFAVTFNRPVPSFSAADVTVAGSAGATAATVSGGPVSYTALVTAAPGSGSVTVTVSVPADAAIGPFGSATATDPAEATVFIDRLPVIERHADVTATAAVNASSASVTYAAPAVADDKPGATVVCTPASGFTFPVGAMTVMCTATDSVRQTASTTFKVIVSPGVPPVPPPSTSTGGRLVDTRSSGVTVDGLFQATGGRAADSVLEVKVAGRGGVAADGTVAVLNVTAVDAAADGYITVFPCGSQQPNASNLNFAPGTVVPNAVVASIGVGGKVCVYTSARTHLLVDAGGQAPPGTVTTFNPARLIDTRPGSQTIDHRQEGGGLVGAGSITTLQVTGRGSVPTGASSVVLNVTVTGPMAPGFLTVFVCDAAQPNASSLNYDAGTTIANLVVTKVSAAGTVCVFTSARTHLLIDVGGYTPNTSRYAAVDSVRLLDTRPTGMTVDAVSQRAGLRPAGSTTEVMLIGRGVAAGSIAVMLNITVTGATDDGYVTVYPCGGTPPNTSNVNYSADGTVANAALSAIAPSGKICLYNSGATHLIVDLSGYQRP
jgi:alpha-tubulin suppressor-like RCC1 family protein